MKVIFVCTGNTCRSPFAEALARQMAADRALAVEFSSAGTGAALGAPANDGAMLVGLERGLDLSRHRSRPLLPEDVAGDTIVLAMSRSHIPVIHAVVPDARVALLDEYGSRGASLRSVADPFGGDLNDYRHAADEIQQMLGPALDRIAADRSAESQ
ncbi:MAG: low molecular weight protein arginine phosphatase [Gemmatimonadaceae bacterium]